MRSSGAAMLTNRCPTHTYVLYRSLIHGFSRRNWHPSSISGHQPVLNTLFRFSSFKQEERVIVRLGWVQWILGCSPPPHRPGIPAWTIYEACLSRSSSHSPSHCSGSPPAASSSPLPSGTGAQLVPLGRCCCCGSGFYCFVCSTVLRTNCLGC